MNPWLPNPWNIESKDDVLPYFQDLLDREVDSASEYQRLLADASELESALSEDMAWR